MIRTAYLSRVERSGHDYGSHEYEPELPDPRQRTIDTKLQMQKLGEFSGDNPVLNDILGVPGLIAPTDKVMASRIELTAGGNVRPFYAEFKDSKSYIVPVLGRLGIRLGNFWMRQKLHLVVPGEVAIVEGEAKRSFEAPTDLGAKGYLLEVNMGDFDNQAVQTMAEPFLRSENQYRASAAQRLVWEVMSGNREPMSARSQLESWYQEPKAS